MIEAKIKILNSISMTVPLGTDFDDSPKFTDFRHNNEKSKNGKPSRPSHYFVSLLDVYDPKNKYELKF